jgi:hypothetical protein
MFPVSSRRRARRAVSSSLAIAVAVALGAAATAAAQAPQVVTSGLDNPRGLTIGPGGDLFVAEAGKGGGGPCIVAGEGGEQCAGPTGALTRVDPVTGAKSSLLDGLPSLATQSGPDAQHDSTGPQDISFKGDIGYFTVGLGATPADRESLGVGATNLGRVLRIDVNVPGVAEQVADLAAYEAANDPDKGQPGAEGVNSNPYSVDATGRSLLVTDAGGNDVLRVTKDGHVRTVTVLPFTSALAPPMLGLPPGAQVPVQPVPTGIIRGSHGDDIVGQLTGFPFPVGAANVFRVAGHSVKVEESGFTNVVDVAYGRHGTLFVLQIDSTGLAGPPSPGKLIRIDRDGTRTELAAGQLQEPTGLTVSRKGDVYVTNNGGSPTDGQILHIAAADAGD